MIHALWIPLKRGDRGFSAGDWKCSNCGKPNATWKIKPPFCSQCGAKMDLKEGQMTLFDFIDATKATDR